MAIKVDNRLSAADQAALTAFLTLLDTDTPDLQQIWACMDFVWDAQGCDNQNVQPDKLADFYCHPVWLLNGLFIEQHDASLANRELFSDWVAQQSPGRVADVGGGFGTLARAIADKSPDIQVEVIEPHAHYFAQLLAGERAGLSYQERLSGEYDMLIATDVFEHVADPLALLESTAAYLAPEGRYLIANCFFPVIKCHLPCAFHFRYTWSWVLRGMNLEPVEQVAYGTVFQKRGPVSAAAARRRAFFSRWIFSSIELMIAVFRWGRSLLTRLVRQDGESKRGAHERG